VRLPVTLQLAATVLQFLAGFVLSVEAIGLARVRRSIAGLAFLRSAFTRREETQPRLPREVFLDPSRILAGVAAMVGAAFGYYLGSHGPAWAHSLPAFLRGQFAPLAGAVVAALFATLVVYGVLTLLAFLQHLDSRVRSGTAGVLGFVLLTLGYLIQFVATLMQATSQ
jgi:hypothetical protein